jgi:putative serine protease PepD
VASGTASGTTAVSAAASGTVAAAAAKIMPSVVTINVTESGGTATGSGVVIRSDGYILTNAHVVNGATSITVTTSGGKTYTGTVVGTDTDSDLAVVKVNANGLTPAAFADSGKVAVGQLVVAVGSPLGLSGTVTSGVISALDRTIDTGSSSGGSSAIYNALQTDTAINPGNSGGALVDSSGAVVGITSSIATVSSSNSFPGQQQSQSGNIGVGFAIPSDQALRIANQLIGSGTATHASLGVSASTAGENQTTGDGTGATLAAVTSGGPAASAGLTTGDVVTSVDGRAVTSSDDLVGTVRSYAPGTTVTVTYTRGGTTHTARVTLGSQASASDSSSSSSTGQ